MKPHLTLWLTIPPLLMATLSLPSFAIGITLVSLISLAIFSIKQKTIKIKKIFLVFLLGTIIWIAIPSIAFESASISRQALSLISLLFCMIACSTFKESDIYHTRSAQILLAVFLIAGIASIISPFRPGNYANLNYPVFPFLEPSHFALAYTLVAGIALTKMQPNTKALFCISTIILAIFIPNTTLLISAITLSLLHLSKRHIFAALTCIVIAIFALAPLFQNTITYLTDRLTSQNSENLSRLVYIQGWENMYSAITSTSGLGVGFQNFGAEPGGAATDAIEALTGSQLNRLDGSFLFAKLGGEFGVIGVCFSAYLLIISLRSALQFRKYTDGKMRHLSSSEAISLSVTSMLALEILIRCPGYFSPSLLITLSALPTAIRILDKGNPKKTHRNYV